MKGFLLKSLLIIASLGSGLMVFNGFGYHSGNNATLGMQFYIEDFYSLDSESHLLEVIDAAGVNWVSIEFAWDKVEVSPGLYHWVYQDNDSVIDLENLISHLAKRNIHILGVLSGGPTYLVQGAPGNTSDTDLLLDNWQRYVQTVLSTFGQQIDTWQIGKDINTPAGWGKVLFAGQENAYAYPDPQLYSLLLQKASAVIRENDPGASILLGSLVSNTNECATQPAAYLHSIYNSGAWESFDAISIAIHAASASPENAEYYQTFEPQSMRCMAITDGGFTISEQVSYIKNNTKTYSEKPVWINGIGWDDNTSQEAALERATLTDIVLSDYLTRATFNLMADANAERIFWYLPSATYGFFLENDSSSVILALKNLNDLSLTKAISRKENTSVVNVKEYWWRANGKQHIGIWRTIGGDELVPISLKDMQGSTWMAHAIDSSSIKWTNGIPLPLDSTGQLNMLINERPVVISGKSDEIIKAIAQTLRDVLNNAGEAIKGAATDWIGKEKQRTAENLSNWVEKQQESLFIMLKESFKEWLLESLHLTTS